MSAPDILIEHKRGEKVQKRLRVRPDRPVFVIGSSADADLKIAGEGIGGCHAVLKYRAPHWYVCDLSGTESLKVNDRPVAEAKVDESTVVEIGVHRLRLFAKEKEAPLFNGGEVSGIFAHHQVVVRARGAVIETHLLKLDEVFKYADGDLRRDLPAPKDGRWHITEVGSRTVQQRLVTAQEVAAPEKIELDRGLRMPLITGLSMIFLLAGLMALAPKRDAAKPEVALDKKSMEVIFNAKAIKQKRAESQKVVKTAKARSGGQANAGASPQARSSQPDESMAPVANPRAAAALTSIRSSGLSALVGKIAKRANRQGIMVGTAGVSADKQGTGRGFFSTGTSLGTGGGAAVKEGPGYRLGGVATHGKGGGVGGGAFREGTGLSGKGVGTGDIVATIDEETVIDGGLDRDAIAEVIKRNIGQIRYCYERQLSSNPDLYGKVLVRFTIGGDGGVSGQRIDSSTLKSAMVEGCILRRMAAWKFPLPKGGTQVNVSYPFLFKALD